MRQQFVPKTPLCTTTMCKGDAHSLVRENKYSIRIESRFLNPEKGKKRRNALGIKQGKRVELGVRELNWAAINEVFLGIDRTWPEASQDGLPCRRRTEGVPYVESGLAGDSRSARMLARI